MGSPHSVVVDAELSRLGAVTVNDVDVETMAKLQHTCSTGSTAGLVGTLTVRQLMNEKHGSSTSPSDSVPQPRPDVVIDDGVPSLNLIKFALICDRSDDAGIATPVAVSSVSSVSPCETLAKPISKPIVKRQAGRSLVRRGWSGRSHTGKNHNRQQSAPRSK